MVGSQESKAVAGKQKSSNRNRSSNQKPTSPKNIINNEGDRSQHPIVVKNEFFYRWLIGCINFIFQKKTEANQCQQQLVRQTEKNHRQIYWSKTNIFKFYIYVSSTIFFYLTSIFLRLSTHLKSTHFLFKLTHFN